MKALLALALLTSCTVHVHEYKGPPPRVPAPVVVYQEPLPVPHYPSTVKYRTRKKGAWTITTWEVVDPWQVPAGHNPYCTNKNPNVCRARGW